MKIFISSDHAGFALRAKVVRHLTDGGQAVVDIGPSSPDPLDYPDEAMKVGRLVRRDSEDRGILVCGSGVGVCMAANKVHGVRAVDAWNLESARLSRAHNDANVLCLGERLIPDAEALRIVDLWLATPFEGGRHAGRVAKLTRIETEEAAPSSAAGQ